MMTTKNLREELARQIKHLEIEILEIEILEKQRLVTQLRTTWFAGNIPEPKVEMSIDEAIFKGVAGILPSGKMDA
jgi:hypothetical protein